MTARELSQELEVSERTIYRDMDVLSSAHFPIYSEKGKDGGYALQAGADLDLSGFNDRDLQALAALNIPGPFFEIGLGSGLKTALEKLLSVLDEDFHQTKTWQKNRFLILPVRTDKKPQANSGLNLLQKAVRQDQIISCQLIYPIHFGLSDRIELAPHTLIAAQGQWYLIAQRKDYYRVFPLTQLVNIQITDKSFARDENFNARQHWDHWVSNREQNLPSFPVIIEIQLEMLRYFYSRFNIPYDLIEDINPRNGWQKIRVYFETLDQARTILLSLGGSFEVIEPAALRLSIIDFANKILDTHESEAS